MRLMPQPTARYANTLAPSADIKPDSALSDSARCDDGCIAVAASGTYSVRSFVMSPIEKNARRLVGVLAEFFPAGSDCEDLRLKFQKIANRSHATFYSCLRFAKANRWIVADGKTYTLNPDGCWRTPPIREEIGAPPVWERHQFEHVLTLRAERIDKLEKTNRRLTGSRRAIAAGEAAGPAIGALAMIMSDPAVSIRKRVQAAEGLLAYKTPQEVAESAKLFLASIFTDPDQNIDDRLAATTALRRSEDVRIVPAIERPPARPDDSAEAEEPVVPLKQLVAERRARMDRILALSLEERAALIPGCNGGNGSDDDHGSQ
jgi:hypothetical protein